MSTIKQSTWFGSNTVNTSSGSLAGLGGLMLAAGVAGGFVMLATIIGPLIGGALALGITIISWAIAGAIGVPTLTRAGLHITHYCRTGQLPPARPLLTINRPLALEPAQPHTPRMTVTRADYEQDRL